MVKPCHKIRRWCPRLDTMKSDLFTEQSTDLRCSGIEPVLKLCPMVAWRRSSNINTCRLTYHTEQTSSIRGIRILRHILRVTSTKYSY